jgi:hypothetical protein
MQMVVADSTSLEVLRVIFPACNTILLTCILILLIKATGRRRP